jgi:type III restriction enzyme
MTISYDPALIEQVSYTLDLRRPNAEALDTIAKALDVAPAGAELVADLATGVGKTYVAGGLLDYLYESGVRNVVIVTPGSTIQNKTIANLTPGHPKYLRGLQCNPLVVTLDDFERGTVGAALEDKHRFKVFVFTVQSLLNPRNEGNRRAHRPHETLGQALYEYLQDAEDLVVIADEHHVYFSQSAKAFQRAVEDLSPAALIGLTATPHPATDAGKIVYQYPLAAAIADGYVKIPVLVARQDGMKDFRTQLADGVALLDVKAQTMRAYCQQTRQPYVQPILFLVTERIEEAEQYRDLLAGPDFFNDDEQVLLITSQEPDETLAKLDTLEQPGSKVRAVVSVDMLREGWDVKNIYVIAAVRALESELLTEQILGRGLRLPFNRRTGVPMLDTVEVLSHHAFADLLRDAKSLLQQVLDDRVTDVTVTTVVTPGVTGDTISVDNPEETAAAGDSATTVSVTAPGPAAPETDPNQGTFDLGIEIDQDAPVTEHEVAQFSTVETRLAAATAAAQAVSVPVTPRQPNGIRIPLYLPRVTIRWEREPFSLTRINTIDVEALGRQFTDDNGPTLTRKALDAHRGEGGELVEIDIRDLTADEVVYATQTLIPFDSIQTDLVARIIRSNAIEATVAEANAAQSIAEAFLRGAGVTNETPWSVNHGMLATSALTQWLAGKQSSLPVREVAEVTQARWPDPEERLEGTPPANRNVVTNSRDFARFYPYSGWAKSFYDIVSFDSYSAEFRLAELLEAASSPQVKAWVRINNTVPLAIPYKTGAITRTYIPDFIVIDDQGVYWIVEGKADSEMTDPVVIAKRDAARDWVNTVNASEDVHQKWAYLLASESVIKNSNGSWTPLKTAGWSHQ